MINVENDKNLLRILNEQSTAEQNYTEEIKKLKRNAMQNEIIIPVIGIQGVGKSTLLNAIIGEEILPNEADETTCVPVEIRYAVNDGVEAFFKNGTVKRELQTKEDLSTYVDNNNNPGNEKGVEKIIVYRHYPILKSGLVFVDLPGVGSLTKSNEKTTREYLKKMCVAMFVIPSALKDADAKLIKLIWGEVSSVFFVENIWDDETEEDIDVGIDFNKKALEQMASELKLKSIPPILILNAYKAALGTYKENQTLIDESGLPKLIDALEKFQSKYKDLVEVGVEEKERRYVALAAENLSNKIDNAKLTTDELNKKLQKESEVLLQNNQKLQAISDDIKTYINNKNIEMKLFAEKIANETGNLLKTDIYYRIDCGLVDGEKLRTAFEDLQNNRAEEAFDKIKGEYAKIEEELKEKIQNIEELINEEAWNPTSVQFHKNEALKWEKGVGIGFKLGGAYAGFLVYGAVGGPVGILAAGIAYAVCSFFGNRINEIKMNQRKRETKEQIKPYIIQFKRIILESVINQYAELEKIVRSNLDQYINDRKEFSKKQKENIEFIKQEAKINKTRVDDLQKDLNYLKEKLGTTNEQ